MAFKVTARESGAQAVILALGYSTLSALSWKQGVLRCKRAGPSHQPPHGLVKHHDWSSVYFGEDLSSGDHTPPADLFHSQLSSQAQPIEFSVQCAPSLLQVGSSNPAYDKIFDHLTAVKYKGEGSLLLIHPLLENSIFALG